jgi:hypothetical protein
MTLFVPVERLGKLHQMLDPKGDSLKSVEELVAELQDRCNVADSLLRYAYRDAHPEDVPTAVLEWLNPMNQRDRDQLLLQTYTAKLHQTAALSAPPEVLVESIEQMLDEWPDVLEAAEQDVPGQP